MSVYIDSILFQDEFTGSYSVPYGDVGVPYLMGCVGDFMYATIDFHVAWNLENFSATFNSSDKTIRINGANLLGGYFSSSITKTSSLKTGFISAGFNVGDNITITGTTANDGNYTIYKISENSITVNESISTTGSYSLTSIYGTTPVNGMDFYYNILDQRLIRNFNSLSDLDSIQKFSGVVTNSTFSLEPNSTSNAWWVSKANGVACIPNVTNNGVESYKQQFTIVFPFIITPLFLSDQLSNLQNAETQSKTTDSLNIIDYKKPSYFINSCLNFIYQIDFKYDVTNPNIIQTSLGNIDFGSGNTSWFNSFFPSGVKIGSSFLNSCQFNTYSVSYTDIDGNFLDSIDINNPTNVSVIVANVYENSMNEDSFVLNFLALQSDKGVYQGYQESNQAVYREILLHDRCKSKIGSSATNGDMFNTPIQAITNVTSESINDYTKKINFIIDLGTLSKSTLSKLIPNDSNYLIFITPQTNSVTSLKLSDRSAIIVDVNRGFINTDDASLLQINTNSTTDVHFFSTENNNITESPKTDFKGFVGGYGIAKCNFKVRENCIVKSINVGFEVEVYKPNGYYYSNEIVDSFGLESWNKSTEQFFDKNITQIYVNESCGYALPANDVRNKRSINIIDGSDSIFTQYQLLFGFQLGYKYLQSLPNWSDQFEKYHTNYWALYTQGYTSTNVNQRIIADGYGSNIKFKIIWDILDLNTNISTKFISSSNISCYDNGNNQYGVNLTLDIQDIYGSSLFGVIPNDIPFNVVGTATTEFEFNENSTAEVVLFYDDGTKQLYDRITTQDNNKETTSSFFTVIPYLLFSSDKKNCSLLVSLDLSSSILPLKNCNIFVKIYP